MSKKRLDASWTAWLNENLQRGCNAEELLGILLRNAFDVQSIRKVMGSRYPSQTPTALAAENRKPGPIDYQAIATPRLTRPGSGAVRFASDRVQLYALDRFLGDTECDEIVALIDQHLRPSTITLPSDQDYCISRTSDLSFLDSPLVARLDEKIASTLGISSSYSEGIQAQRYDAGEQFKEHTDYFEPGTAEYAEHATLRGTAPGRSWCI